MNITSIIIAAQKSLVNQPFDLAHDITHHYRVYEWSMRIIDEENLKVDKEVVAVCAWMHDLGGRRAEDLNPIRTILEKQKVSEEFIKQVLEIISEHSFGEAQNCIESKILFDADKLEYVNSARLTWFYQAVKDGYLSREKFEMYRQTYRDRVGRVSDLLHFDFSKKQFRKFLPKAEKIISVDLP